MKTLKENNRPIKSTTCFHEHDKLNVTCEKSSCKYWIDSNDNSSLNCVLISASRGKKTLQEIGDIFGITRMRICQIEKTILKKLSKKQTFIDVS